MLKRIQIILATVTMSLGMTAGFALPVDAQASGASKQAVCEGITAGGGACNDDGGGITNVIKVVINILSIVAGVAAVIMIIVAGMRYITSGGDSSKISGAKSAITYAIIGLVIVALSQFIVRFVLDRTLAN